MGDDAEDDAREDRRRPHGAPTLGKGRSRPCSDNDPASSFCVVAVLIAVDAGFAFAEKGDTEVGFRLIYVTGSATGVGSIADTDSSPDACHRDPGIEIDWVLWPLDELTVEMSLGASPHPVGTTGGTLDGIDGGTLWRLPLSAVAQYRPDLYAQVRPLCRSRVWSTTSNDLRRFIGAYQELFSDVVSSPATINIVVQAGVNYELDLRWSANLDLRYMGMDITGSFTGLDGSTRDEMGFRFDPWVVGLGFRYRY